MCSKFCISRRYKIVTQDQKLDVLISHWVQTHELEIIVCT